MPDFSNNSTYQGAVNDTTAPYNPSVPTVIPGFENLAAESTEVAKLASLEDIMKQPAAVSSFVPGTVPYKDVYNNRRYGMYNPSVTNMEDYAAHGQSAWAQLGNSLVKTGALALGTFAQGMFSIPDTISAITSKDFSKLYDNPIEAKIDEWRDNIENQFPNYYTDWETEHPFLSAVPFVHGGQGFTNFWGDKVVKNLGFTAGAIASAVVQDALIGAVTEGIGTIPLLTAQIGKASLWLNKLFTGTNNVSQVLRDAKLAGESAETLFTIKTLGQLAAGTKLKDGGRYALNLWSSARTEGAIEARDGYNTVKETLIQKYKDANNGMAPEGADMEEIEGYSKASANVRMGGNLALLSISNAIQFDNILKPFNSSRSLRSSIVQRLEGSQIKLAEGSVDRFVTDADVKASIFNYARKKLPEILAEGPLEEGGQFALGEATQKYYEDKYDFYKNPENTGEFDSLTNVISSTIHGLAQEFGTSEGLENVLLGSLTSVITGGIKSLADRARGTYRQEDLRTMGALNSQSLLGTFANNYKDTSNSVAATQDMQKAIQNNDIFQYKNLQHKEFFNFIQSGIKSGRYEVRLEQLKLLNDLSQEEFEKTFDIKDNTENRRTVQEYVGSLIANAEAIKTKYDAIDNIFSNPFRQSQVGDTSEDAVLEGKKWDAFEDYKTQLAYLSSIQEDTTRRLNNINLSIQKISPYISSNLIASLSTNRGLQALRDEYMDKSTSTNEAAQTLEGTPKRDQVRKAQDYKNKAEAINTFLRNPTDETLRSTTLEDVLNFIINGEGVTTDKSIPQERLIDLFTYGKDINLLNRRKGEARKYYNALTTEAGFNKFFNKRDQAPLEPADTITPYPTSPSSFEEGRTYNKPNAKWAFRTKKGSDGKYSLLDPSGNIINRFPTQQEAREEAKKQSQNRNSVKVLQTNENGTIKVQFPNGDVVDLQKYELAGYKLVESEEERLAREAKELAATQKDLFDSMETSGVTTDTSEDISFEDPKKSSNLLFSSTIAFSPEYGGTPKPHHLRANYFASHTLPNMKNTENVRGIVINEQIEGKYGLTGLTALSKGTYTPEEGWNEDNTPLLVVAAEAEGDDIFLLNENGQRIGKLGEQVDINTVVFQTMPTPSLTNSKGENKYRKGEDKAELEKLKESYKTWRKQMLTTDNKGRVYKLSSTLGFVNKDIKQVTPQPVSSIISNSTNRIINVATATESGKKTSTVSNGSMTVEVPLGYPVLVTSNTIQPLSNRRLTADEQSAIYGAMRALATYAQNKDILNSEAQSIINSLKGMIYWGTPNNQAGNNSIWFDKASGSIFFGKTGQSFPFTLESIEKNKTQIQSFLSGMYNNINASYLNDNKFNSPYNEIVGWNGNTPKIRTWKNYQTYLISDAYPDKSSRSISELPLTTNIPSILPKGVTGLNSQTRNGAYFILDQLSIELYQITPKQKKQKEEPPTKDTPKKHKWNSPFLAAILGGDTEEETPAGQPETNADLPKQMSTEDLIAALSKVDYHTRAKILAERGIIDKVYGIDSLRPILVVNVGGVKLPFYRSLMGTSGKTKDKWFPFFGHGKHKASDTEQDWFVKGTTQDLENNFGSSTIEAYSRILNSLFDYDRTLDTPNVISGNPFKDAGFGKLPNINQMLYGNTESGIANDGGDSIKKAYDIIDRIKAEEEAKNLQSLKAKVAAIEDLTDPYDIVLKYFAEGGKITTEALEKLLGAKGRKSINSERKARISLLDKKGDTIDQLAHRLWERDDRHDTQEYRDAIEDALLTHVSAAAMGKALVENYADIEGQARKYYESKGDQPVPEPATKKAGSGIFNSEDKNLGKEPGKKSARIDLSALRPLDRGKSDFRVVSQVGRTPENWNQVKEWINKNLPGVPVYRVKNLLHVMGDTYAWGAYSEGALYVYENAELGTFYHEAFHAVARNFLSRGELSGLRYEFRNRKGSFTEYITGNTVKYSEATDAQIDEELAEEFRKYSLKPTSILGRIGRFFSDLWNWIKSIIEKRNTIQELFRQINAGKYRNYTTGRNIQGITDIDYANTLVNPDFMLAPGEKFDLLQHIQGLSLDYFLARDENGKSRGLFNTARIGKDQFYNMMKDLVQRSLIDTYIYDAAQKLDRGELTQDEFQEILSYRQDLLDKIEENWNEIIADHAIMMSAYNIQFDENDVLQAKDENKSGRGDYQDAMKVDSIKKSSLSIKLLFSTIRQVTLDSKNDTYALQDTTLATSSVGGDILVEMGKSFVTMLDNLADTRNFDAQIDALVNLAGNDPNYIRLFTALRGSRVNGKINWDVLSGDDLRLLILFSKTFAKQKPQGLIQYILEDGTVVIRSADYAKQTDVLMNQWTSNIIDKARKGTGYFYYDRPKGQKKGAYYTKGVKKVSLSFPSDRVKFLNNLGITVTTDDYSKMTNAQKKKFDDQVNGIMNALSKPNLKVSVINRQTLDISKNMETLAGLIARIQNPSSSSTFFNQNGELQQTYVEKNYASHVLEILNSVSKKSDLDGTILSYLNTDTFSTNSKIMEKLFDEDGNRTTFKPNIAYITGTVDAAKGKVTDIDRLSKGSRLLQEINVNLMGYYNLLESADSSTQWMWNIGQVMPLSSFDYDGLKWNNIYETFSKYLIDEINLARENRPNVNDASKLRFFDGILNGVVSQDDINSTKSPEEIYQEKKQAIDDKVKSFLLDKVGTMRDLVYKYKLATWENANTITFKSLNITGTGITSNTFSESSLDNLLLYLSTNYALAQMEVFKVILGDPHQSREWLKRAKSFFSPRETIVHSSPELNTQIDQKYNQAHGIPLSPGEVGYMPVEDSMRTATLADSKVSTALYPNSVFEEADGQGLISDVHNRQLRIKAGLWNENEEAQYQYDKAWERLHRRRYVDNTLREKDEALVKRGNPQVVSTYYPLKPIATGNKGTTYNSVILDKYSLAPIPYRAMYEFASNSNMLKLIQKMYDQNIGYVVFKSGRKVGSEGSNSLYNTDGSFNTNPLHSIVSIPFEILGIQVQTQPKEENSQTLGSQLSKLVTLDMLNGGVPIDFLGDNWDSLSEDAKRNASPIYEEIKHNQKILQELQNDGYEKLLRDIGIKEVEEEIKTIDPQTGDKTISKISRYEIENRDKVADIIEKALLRTDSNDNSKKALEYFKNNLMSLESTNMYQQFKNILYSIIDRNIVSPKVTGGPKVQVASTLFEEVRGAIRGGAYPSTDLKEYVDEDGKRHIEVYISSTWLRRQLPKSWSNTSSPSYKTDEELYSLLESTSLNGVGFRIPTQAPNSADVFVIKKFLPIEMGDTVVVPSSMVKKGGSDFDIDKLNSYLKSIYWDGKAVRTIPFQGIGQVAKDLFENIYYDILGFKLEEAEDSKQRTFNLQSTFGELNLTDNEKFKSKWTNIFRQMFGEDATAAEVEDALMTQLERIGKRLEDLNDPELNDVLVNKFVSDMYSKSLQNEYYDSLQRLLTHPQYFERLTQPNDASLLKGLARRVRELKGDADQDTSTPAQLLDRNYVMSNRHNFLTGKNAVGIAAVAQTGHSLRQRIKFLIDFGRLKGMSAEMKEWIANPKMAFGKVNYNTIDDKPSLSNIRTANGKYIISDIISQFIDGAVDVAKGAWIVELLGDIRKLPTALFMTELGFDPQTTVFFLNQPIIEDYLQKIDNAGYNWLFIDSFVEELLADPKYRVETNARLILATDLEKTIGKDKFNTKQKETQKLVLHEFLKYAKMANHLFLATQGTNWDTTDFTDPYIVYKKNKQLEIARQTIFSGVDDLLRESFIGNTRRVVQNSREAIAQYIPTESPEIRGMIEHILSQYLNQSNREFVKTARSVVNSFIDYAIQMYHGYTGSINELILDSQTNIPQRLQTLINDLKENDPNNDILNNPFIRNIDIQLGERTNNFTISGKMNSVYDQNVFIHSIQELKNNPITQPLYPDILRFSMLQGIGNSPISFTQLLPAEDVKDILSPIFDNVNNIPGLLNFAEVNAFERNNWNNTDLIPSTTLWKKSKNEKDGTFDMYQPFANVLRASQLASDTFNKYVIAIDSMSRVSDGDVITITYQKEFDEQGEAYTKKRIFEMKKAGDFSFMSKFLFKKVYASPGNPFTRKRKVFVPVEDAETGEVTFEETYRTNIFFKAINAWGNTFRLQEYYSAPQQSQVENGYDKVPVEFPDQMVVDLVTGKNVEQYFVQDGFMDLSPKELLEDYAQAPQSGVRVDKSMPWNLLNTLPVYNNRGVNVMRKQGSTEHFGNPFIGSVRQGKPTKIDNRLYYGTIEQAREAYRQWLEGTAHQDIQPMRREWILEQIDSGNLDNKTLLYYEPQSLEQLDGTTITGGYYSHADVLAEIVRARRENNNWQNTDNNSDTPFDCA